MSENFGVDISKFKMVIYLKNNDRKVFYSLTNEEKKGDRYAINGMIRRLLEKRYKNTYHTAVVYNRETNIEVLKMIEGRRVI